MVFFQSARVWTSCTLNADGEYDAFFVSLAGSTVTTQSGSTAGMPFSGSAATSIACSTVAVVSRISATPYA